MEMMIHCPSCHARLNVSKKAAGHSVRCPKCKKPFKVPSDDREIVEDTVACWLEISAEEEQARKQQAATIPDPLDELPEYIPPDDLPGLDSPNESQLATQVQTRTATRAAPAAKTAPPKRPAPPAPNPAAAVSAPATPASPAPAAVGPTVDVRGDIGLGGEVRLRILESHATGTVLGFNGELLKRLAFRASMPMACIGCGEREAQNLVARPLIWADRLVDHSTGAAQLAAKYELPVRTAEARELVSGMRPVDEITAPCNNPMPYYACRRCGMQAMIQAHTTADSAGTMCVTTIPSPAYALEWLGRVNGVCGDDYLELEAMCAAAGGDDDAFSELPDQIRKRLAGWYQPVDGERFVLYLKDGDYPKSDAGLGGLVLTTQRLVYCKYHKHGSLLLHDENTQLLATRNGPFDDLVSVTDGMKSKLLRLRPDDTQQLMTTLEEMDCRLKLQQS
jgi:predicted Zn finger-like uncharacterized protein